MYSLFKLNNAFGTPPSSIADFDNFLEAKEYLIRLIVKETGIHIMLVILLFEYGIPIKWHMNQLIQKNEDGNKLNIQSDDNQVFYQIIKPS